jgi:glycosyltransferase involved in cell wall biosynthesis
MVSLSVVIITFNEEQNIGRCLESVQDVADEILVVDSYSTDRTEAICRDYGANFIQHPFEGHIQQKNYAITQARYPHILSLDADEVLSEELKASVQRTKSHWKHDGYSCKRLTNYCGKWIRHSGWYPDRKLRLWDSRKGRWGGNNPHDRFELEPGSTTGRLKGDLLHYSFHSISQHMDTVNKFSQAAARSLYEKGVGSSTLKILVKSTAKFIRNYFFKAGFLDGYYGYLICRISAFSSMLRYAKLKEMYRKGA